MANLKPGRAKDNARAKVDVPKRKSAEGTATPANTRPTSASDVWAAMETLLGHRRVLNLQSKTAAKRLRSIESREFSEAERAYWTRARAEADDALRGLDDAVLKASARVDGLVDLATNNVNAASSSWVPPQREETLRLFDEARGAVDARIKTRKRSPTSDEGRAEAWRAVVALGLRLDPNFDQEGRDAAALREQLERLCGDPPESTKHGRAALIVERLTRAPLDTLEQWRRRLRKSGSSPPPRH